MSSRTRPGGRALVLALALGWLLFPVISMAEITITLKNSFIEKFRSRATIDATFLVDKSHTKPNSASKDGDLHVAGRAKEVQLPIVAELMNAKTDTESVDLLKSRQGTNNPLDIQGVWRIWCEHGGGEAQVQGEALQPFTTTNPDHVFEIHPVTKVGSKDTRSTFGPIPGFKYKDAEVAFAHYENVRSTIVPKATTTTIKTNMAGYNYVEFKIKPRLEKIIPRADGHTVMGSVHALEGHMLVRNRRLVFVEGTEPDARLMALQADECMHVLGIPRISLELVAWRKSTEGRGRGALNWNLPYEMVIVGLLSDTRECEDE